MQLLWLNQSHFCAASSLSPRAPCLLLGLCWAHGETSEGWHHLCTALQIWKGKRVEGGFAAGCRVCAAGMLLGAGPDPPPPSIWEGAEQSWTLWAPALVVVLSHC